MHPFLFILHIIIYMWFKHNFVGIDFIIVQKLLKCWRYLVARKKKSQIQGKADGDKAEI